MGPLSQVEEMRKIRVEKGRGTREEIRAKKLQQSAESQELDRLLFGLPADASATAEVAMDNMPWEHGVPLW